ncbi:IPT/TIG domain-containing protein [Streptomyces kronopolitis]|uniref:IPT/TIG domain-containing protein n=1 Tax=Streptomyces kronopolitis TaxID=1612435 RepID=UPI0036AFDF36
MAPVVTSVSPDQGAPDGNTGVTLTGFGFTGATMVKFGPTSAGFLVVSDTQITARTPAGTGTAAVTVTAPTGTSTQNALFAYALVAAPVLTSLSPTSGPTAGGNAVILTGTNLSGATSVKFGDNPATVLSSTASQLVVSAPTGAPSTVNVMVATTGGTSNPLPYLYLAAPTVNDLSTHLGPATGGNTVSVFGSDLLLASAVSFGGNPATGLTVVSDSRLTVTAPPGSGTVTVTVTTPGGTSTAATGNPSYTYLGAPVLTGLTPSHGSALGGDAIVLGGSGLTYTDAVTFGGVRATFSAVSDTQVVATSPAGAPGTVNVVAHTPAGSSNPRPYVYDPA